MKKECPLCGNYLMRGIIIKTGEEILVCDDDEFMFVGNIKRPLDLDDHVGMRAYLKSQGLEPTWDSIKIIEEIADI